MKKKAARALMTLLALMAIFIAHHFISEKPNEIIDPLLIKTLTQAADPPPKVVEDDPKQNEIIAVTVKAIEPESISEKYVLRNIPAISPLEARSCPCPPFVLDLKENGREC